MLPYAWPTATFCLSRKIEPEPSCTDCVSLLLGLPVHVGPVLCCLFSLVCRFRYWALPLPTYSSMRLCLMTRCETARLLPGVPASLLRFHCSSLLRELAEKFCFVSLISTHHFLSQHLLVGWIVLVTWLYCFQTYFVICTAVRFLSLARDGPSGTFKLNYPLVLIYGCLIGLENYLSDFFTRCDLVRCIWIKFWYFVVV